MRARRVKYLMFAMSLAAGMYVLVEGGKVQKADSAFRPAIPKL